MKNNLVKREARVNKPRHSNKRSKHVLNRGLQAYLREMAEEHDGFFKKPRTISQVHKEIIRRGDFNLEGDIGYQMNVLYAGLHNLACKLKEPVLHSIPTYQAP